MALVFCLCDPLSDCNAVMKLFERGHQFFLPQVDNSPFDPSPASGGDLTVFIHQTTTLIPTGQRNPAPLTIETSGSLFSRNPSPHEPGGRLMEDIYSDQPCDVMLRDGNGVICWRWDDYMEVRDYEMHEP